MPELRVILLLFALLPGMVLPAGIGLDRCECTGSWRIVHAGAARPCAGAMPVRVLPTLLQQVAIVGPTKSAAAETRSCCHVAREAVRIEDDRRGAFCDDDRSCECGAVIVADAPTPWSGGTLRFELEPLTSPTWFVLQLPPPLRCAEQTPISQRGPPPPGRYRNLPLLL